MQIGQFAKSPRIHRPTHLSESLKRPFLGLFLLYPPRNDLQSRQSTNDAIFQRWAQ